MSCCAGVLCVTVCFPCHGHQSKEFRRTSETVRLPILPTPAGRGALAQKQHRRMYVTAADVRKNVGVMKHAKPARRSSSEDARAHRIQTLAGRESL